MQYDSLLVGILGNQTVSRKRPNTAVISQLEQTSVRGHRCEDTDEIQRKLRERRSLPPSRPDSRFSQHGDPDHPQNLIDRSLYHCRAIMKI